mgnify:CR=1 FL=1
MCCSFTALTMYGFEPGIYAAIRNELLLLVHLCTYLIILREIVSLLGPSGIGKTTILRTIAGLEKINNGSIIINNKTISSKYFA